MITEDYVSFETAKLLKEKGFDWKLPFIYVSIEKNKKVHLLDTIDNYNDDHIEHVISAPTLQMAKKWLMKNYNIYITAVPNGIGENVFYMGIYRKYDYGWTYISDCLDEEYKEAEFYTPEEACEAAIKYCLENLI